MFGPLEDIASLLLASAQSSSSGRPASLRVLSLCDGPAERRIDGDCTVPSSVLLVHALVLLKPKDMRISIVAGDDSNRRRLWMGGTPLQIPSVYLGI